MSLSVSKNVLVVLRRCALQKVDKQSFCLFSSYCYHAQYYRVIGGAGADEGGSVGGGAVGERNTERRIKGATTRTVMTSSEAVAHS